MADFRPNDDARADVRRIYQYGVGHFGEAQADKYLDNLFDRFEDISEHPLRCPR